MTEYRGDWFTLEISATEAAHPFRQARTSIEVCHTHYVVLLPMLCSIPGILKFSSFLQVYLYKNEDTIRLVLKEPAETVHANKDEILNELSDIAGFQLVFANLRYHVDQENNIHKNWSVWLFENVDVGLRWLTKFCFILKPKLILLCRIY